MLCHTFVQTNIKEMCEIKDWLSEHPAISVRMMEKTLGLPIGTVRVRSKRAIPERYKKDIKQWLGEYGMLSDCKSERKQYFLRNDRLVYKEDGLWRRKNIGDDIPLYIE